MLILFSGPSCYRIRSSLTPQHSVSSRASIPCLQLEEAAAEKIRAAFQRPKIRDLHELQQLRKQRFDPELVRRMAVLKLWESPEGRSFEPFTFDIFCAG